MGRAALNGSRPPGISWALAVFNQCCGSDGLVPFRYRRQPSIGAPLTLLLLTAIALVVFFFAADVASIPFTGYGRFLAYPLLAVCGPDVRNDSTRSLTTGRR